MTISLITLMLSLSSCAEKPVTKEHEDSKFKNNAFDSAMIAFASKYKDVYDHDIMPNPDTIPFRYFFEIDKSVYVPKKRNLTFEFRSYTPITGKYYGVVFIHSDSLGFLLPFTDYSFYRKRNIQKINGNNSYDVSKVLTFETELNGFFHLIKPSSEDELTEILDEIMRGLSYNRMVVELDLKSVSVKLFAFADNTDIREECRNAIKANYETIQRELTKPRTLIYSNGLMFITCEVSEDLSIKVNYFNTECLY